MTQYNKMFEFVKQIFILAMIFFGSGLPSVNSLQCISMNNQECKVRPQIFKVNSKEPVFFPFSIKTSKFSGSCNNINNLYTKLRVPDVMKNLNVEVFNLMSRNNETRPIEWMKCLSVNVEQMQAFVIINNVGMMINAVVNAKN